MVEKMLAIWKWIDRIKSDGVQMDATASQIRKRLLQLPSPDREAVQCDYIALYEETDTLLLWEVCSLLLGTTASDDSFEYFRNWLMWGGHEFFEGVLKEPDALADLADLHHHDLSHPHFEGLSVVGADIGFAKSSHLASHQSLSNRRPWSWHDSSSERIKRDLPKLWHRLGDKFHWDPPVFGQRSSMEAPGLGYIGVGDRVRHKFGYGEGVVIEVLVPEAAIASVQFSDARRPLRITSEHFERA